MGSLLNMILLMSLHLIPVCSECVCVCVCVCVYAVCAYVCMQCVRMCVCVCLSVSVLHIATS